MKRNSQVNEGWLLSAVEALNMYPLSLFSRHLTKQTERSHVSTRKLDLFLNSVFNVIHIGSRLRQEMQGYISNLLAHNLYALFSHSESKWMPPFPASYTQQECELRAESIQVSVCLYTSTVCVVNFHIGHLDLHFVLNDWIGAVTCRQLCQETVKHFVSSAFR